jgi:hypothetical protein
MATMVETFMNVRRNSGKVHFQTIVALSLLYIQLLSVPVHAATMTGIAGTWAASISANFHIGGYATQNYQAYGNCTFTIQNSLIAALSCQGLNDAPHLGYSGVVSVVERSNKLAWSLDAAGIEQVKANLTEWLVRKNAQKGKVLDPKNVSYWIESQSYKPIKMSSDLGAPKLVQGTLKGTLIQRFPNKYVSKPFTYKLKIKTLGPAP